MQKVPHKLKDSFQEWQKLKQKVIFEKSIFLHTGTGFTQPSILSGSVNEYRLQLGRFKAGMCDAAWCAPCT